MECLASSQDPSVDICWGDRLNVEWSPFLCLSIQQTFIDHLIGTSRERNSSEEKRERKKNCASLSLNSRRKIQLRTFSCKK